MGPKRVEVDEGERAGRRRRLLVLVVIAVVAVVAWAAVQGVGRFLLSARTDELVSAIQQDLDEHPGALAANTTAVALGGPVDDVAASLPRSAPDLVTWRQSEGTTRLWFEPHVLLASECVEVVVGDDHRAFIRYEPTSEHPCGSPR